MNGRCLRESTPLRAVCRSRVKAGLSLLSHSGRLVPEFRVSVRFPDSLSGNTFRTGSPARRFVPARLLQGGHGLWGIGFATTALLVVATDVMPRASRPRDPSLAGWIRGPSGRFSVRRVARPSCRTRTRRRRSVADPASVPCVPPTTTGSCRNSPGPSTPVPTPLAETLFRHSLLRTAWL